MKGKSARKKENWGRRKKEIRTREREEKAAGRKMERETKELREDKTLR